MDEKECLTLLNLSLTERFDSEKIFEAFQRKALRNMSGITLDDLRNLIRARDFLLSTLKQPS